MWKVVACCICQGIKRDAPSGEDAIAAAVYANQLGEAGKWWRW